MSGIPTETRPDFVSSKARQIVDDVHDRNVVKLHGDRPMIDVARVMMSLTNSTSPNTPASTDINIVPAKHNKNGV